VDDVGAGQARLSKCVGHLIVVAEAVDGSREFSLRALVAPVGEDQAAAGLQHAGDLPEWRHEVWPEIEGMDREDLVEGAVRVRKSLR
jgi:hypothetical protein